MTTEDSFYTNKKINDLYRIPLIKPHQLVSSGGIGYDWFYKLHYNPITEFDDSEINIIKVGMYDSIIVLYNPSYYIYNEMNELWLIVNVINKQEKVFIKKEEYSSYLQMLGIDEITLYDIDSVYRQFEISNTFPF